MSNEPKVQGFNPRFLTVRSGFILPNLWYGVHLPFGICDNIN